MKTYSWQQYKNETEKCMKCRESVHVLIDGKAKPLFTKNEIINTNVLFIMEAPNQDDTYNSSKGYLTIDNETDPSGRFFHELFTQILGFPIEELFLTNSILCLPKKNKNGKYEVNKKLRVNCKSHLETLISAFNPKVVCTLGLKALEMTRIIDNHNCYKLSDSVAKEINWFGRILFPLYHTGLLARKPPYGRSVDSQRKDWMRLKEVINSLNTSGQF
jgi:uracil-DNA glycosylase family 4